MSTRLHSMVAMSAALLLSPSLMGQDDPDLKTELAALGEDVKAAVIADLIPRSEARSFYKMLADLIQQTRGFDEEREEKEERFLDAARSQGGMTYTRFDFAPESGRLDVLLTPEFTRRDIDVISEALSDDRAIAEVSETLLYDYVRSYDDMRREVGEELESIRMKARVDEASIILEQIQSRRIDWPEVDAKVDGWFSRGAAKGGEAAREKTMQWLENRIVHLDTTIGRYEDLVESQRRRLAERPSPGSTMDPRAIVEIARMERESLRTGLVDGLHAIGGDASRGPIDHALDRIRLSHGRRDLRFGGGNVDFWAVLDALALDASLESACLELLRTETPAIAALVDAKMAAAIDREILATAMNAIDDDPEERSRLRDRILDAVRREVRIDLQIREATQTLVDAMATVIAEQGEDLEDAFRNECLLTAFPSQMRVRWSERAMTHALGLSDLDESTLEALLEMDVALASELGELRKRAIATRVREEPIIADAMIEQMAGDEKTVKTLGPMTWREPEYEAFDRFEGRQEAMFKSILRPDQFAQLPARPKSWFDEDKNAGGKKGGDKSTGADKDAGGAKKRAGGGK